MIGNRFSRLLAVGGAGLLFTVCSDRSSAPTELSRSGSSGHSSHVAPDAAGLELEPFTSIGPLDPYHINQPPDFMMQSRARTDLVIQRLSFDPGDGPWHTHPGPSFVIVIEGQIKVQQFTKKDGCVETEVFSPGQAYFEVGNQIHRARVVSHEPVVLHVTRFLPHGAPITTFVDDPGC